MEGASFYTQLAALEVAAILETLPNNCEDLISSKVRANCRELSSLLLGLCDKDVGKRGHSPSRQGRDEDLRGIGRFVFNIILRKTTTKCGRLFSDSGMQDKALKAIQDVVDIHRKLASNHPTTSGFALAVILFVLQMAFKASEIAFMSDRPRLWKLRTIWLRIECTFLIW